MVVIQLLSGSGGSRTWVINPGTISEKWRETKVDIRDDFPTPSAMKGESKGKIAKVLQYKSQMKLGKKLLREAIKCVDRNA